ncbi:hypothetical protein ACH4JZ_18440 [Streptomyces sp. NPDC017615]|uniref:hypothetical protein n=1 Tax=Streptomyces sp. NPDC017615 TaxID=3365003 RepID=UPI003797262B
MGFHHSTYFAYGVHVEIPEDEYAPARAERINEQLLAAAERCPDVGTLTAGAYDADRLFLATHCDEVKLGYFAHVTPEAFPPEQVANWTHQLAQAVHALGIPPEQHSAPGWICVPDMA